MSPDYDFRVQFTDEGGASCEQALRIAVNTGFFYDLTWSAPGIAGMTASHNQWAINFAGSDVGGAEGNRTYTGLLFAAAYDVNITQITGVGSGLSLTVRYHGASPGDFPIFTHDFISGDAGLFHYDFNMPAMLGENVYVNVAIDVTAGTVIASGQLSP